MSRTTGQVATESLLLVVDVSPLVMAIWGQSAIWDIPTAPEGAPGARANEHRIASTGPGGEPYPCLHAPRRPRRTLGGHRRYRETEVRALLAGIPQQRME